MDNDRILLVIEVMAEKKIPTKMELCKILGYFGTAPLLDFERLGDKSTQFSFKFSQYISGWHPDALARLTALYHVFPHLKEVQIEATFSKNTDWLSLNQKTRTWILRHIHPVTSLACESDDDKTIKWVLERKSSVIVAHGEKPIELNSLLVRAFIQCLRSTQRPAQYVFFFHCDSAEFLALSSLQVENALIFLGFQNVLIVASEFQKGGLASKVKEMQDFGTHSTHDFGMLLYGSDKVLSLKTAIEVFYCVRSVYVCHDPLPYNFPTTVIAQP